jgi:Magnesium chelatase, subunit ChlI C-terminal
VHVLKRARTIADLAGADQIGVPHLAEAIYCDVPWYRVNELKAGETGITRGDLFRGASCHVSLARAYCKQL